MRDPGTGHFVDVYEVPCNPTPVRVYVDMYGCAEYQAKLSAPESAEAKRVESEFAANRFQAVAARCATLLHGKELDDAGTRCLTILPASLYLLGKRRQAVVKLGEVCAAFPRSSVDSDVRARLVLETLGAIAQGSERARVRIDRRKMGEDLTRFVAVCQVPDEQIERLLEPMQEAFLLDDSWRAVAALGSSLPELTP